MICIRGIPTNWFQKQTCPCIRRSRLWALYSYMRAAAINSLPGIRQGPSTWRPCEQPQFCMIPCRLPQFILKCAPPQFSILSCAQPLFSILICALPQLILYLEFARDRRLGDHARCRAKISNAEIMAGGVNQQVCSCNINDSKQQDVEPYRITSSDPDPRGQLIMDLA